MVAYTRCNRGRWRNFTLKVKQGDKTIILKGDPSLTKSRVSLRRMLKTWEVNDQGYLIECQALEGGMLLVECYKVDEVHTRTESIPRLLDKFLDVFEKPEELPPMRGVEHHIHLKSRALPVNVRLYRYAYHQKGEMEKLVDEMCLGVIRPSSSPYSSLVLLVKKKDGG